MEVMPVYSITHLQNFIASAKDDGWSILGTAGPGKSPEEVKGGRGNSPEEVKEGRENQGQGRENQGQGRENQGQGRGHTEDSMPKTKSAKMTIDCRDYVKHGPTLLVLGTWNWHVSPYSLNFVFNWAHIIAALVNSCDQTWHLVPQLVCCPPSVHRWFDVFVQVTRVMVFTRKWRRNARPYSLFNLTGSFLLSWTRSMSPWLQA